MQVILTLVLNSFSKEFYHIALPMLGSTLATLITAKVIATAVAFFIV